MEQCRALYPSKVSLLSIPWIIWALQYGVFIVMNNDPYYDDCHTYFSYRIGVEIGTLHGSPAGVLLHLQYGGVLTRNYSDAIQGRGLQRSDERLRNNERYYESTNQLWRKSCLA